MYVKGGHLVIATRMRLVLLVLKAHRKQAPDFTTARRPTGLTPSTRRARYLQIADDLRAKIADGTYPVGAALPSTSQLMKAYDVSVTVVRAAIKELKNDGVAEGQPGKAVYVHRRPAPAEPSTEYRQITQQLENLRATVRQAVQQLDDRLTTLEQEARQSSRRSP